MKGQVEVAPFQTEHDDFLQPQALRVTFDTNTLCRVIDPDRDDAKPYRRAYQAVKGAVKSGQIRGFFSEMVVTLDAIQRKAKAEFLGAAGIASETTSSRPDHIRIAVGPRWPRIEISSQLRARLEAALAMGMRALIGPRRFGDSIVPQGFGEGFHQHYPPGEAFVAMADATNAADIAILKRGLGRAPVIELAKSLSERDGATGEWWPQALSRARSNTDRKKAKHAINEWADGEAVAAHIGYGNDLFCTHDIGRDLRERSILHPSNRAWLAETYGVTFVTIAELDTLLVRAP